MKDLTNEFQPVAEQHKKKEKRRVKVVVYFALSCLVGIVIGNIDSSVLRIAWFLNLAAIVIVFVASRDKPLCPACRQDVVRGMGTHCPECGGTLQKLGPLRGQQCQACTLRPAYNRTGRNYRIKHCTYCGAKLHAVGL